MIHHDRRVAVLSRILMLGTLLAAGCSVGPSEASIKTEFGAYVAGANNCTAASECAVAFADCPLGCEVAVRADRKADVEAKANALVTDYRRSNPTCVYSCAEATAACVAAKCTLMFDRQPPTDGGSD